MDKLPKGKYFRYFSFSSLIAMFISFSHYLLNENWFTTSEITIDPWIYWGAGNNIPLSYQADFSKTYYLERYTITFPQTLFQFLFGPYWSQLFLVSFYIFLITFILLLILYTLKLEQLAIPSILIFLANHKFLGMLAMSYNQAASVTLYLLFILLTIKYTQSYYLKYAFFAGFTSGLLANAYMPHFIVAYVAAFVVIFNLTSIGSFMIWFKHTITGFVAAQFIIQSIHYLIARDYQIVFLKHFYFGLNLSTQNNPWGGNGFTWFWSQGVFSPRGFFWSITILIALLLLNFKHSDFGIQVLRITAIGTFIGMAIFTFGNSNITGYSWFSCILYWIMLPAIVIILYCFPNYLRILTTFLILVFHYLVSDKQIYKIENLANSKYFRFFIITTFLFLILIQILVNISLNRKVTVAVFLFLVVIMQSSYFIASEGGVARNFDAKAIYTTLDREREGLKEIQNQTGRRIWVTPLESIPLQSSLLYMYSLVSTEPNKENCPQINWMLGNKSLLVVTHSTSEKLRFIENHFLMPCGIQATEWNYRKINNIDFGFTPFGSA